MGRRGAIVAGLIVAGVLALVASPRFLPRDEPVYFFGGHGQVTLTGGRSDVVELRDPQNDIYGFIYNPSTSRTFSLGVDAGDGGGLSFSIDDFRGAGSYAAVQGLG